MHELALIERRLQRLERESRRWKRVSLGLALALASGLALGLAPPRDEVVEAERFVLRGADGTEHGVLGLDEKGNPHLLMRKDKAVAAISLTQPGILIRGDDGKRGAFIGVDTRGASKLELTGARFIDGIRMAVHEEGSSGVYVLSQEGRERTSMEYLSNGNAQFTTRDELGRVRGFFGLDAGGTPSIVFLDSQGRRRIGMLIQSDEGFDTPLLALQDGAGKIRTELTSNLDDSPRLFFYGAEGERLFSAP